LDVDARAETRLARGLYADSELHTSLRSESTPFQGRRDEDVFIAAQAQRGEGERRQ
jgi:hypothetical protein